MKIARGLLDGNADGNVYVSPVPGPIYLNVRAIYLAYLVCMMSGSFTEKVREVHAQGLRYMDMALQSNEVRSTAWWNNVARARDVAPPPPEILADIASMMGLTTRQVAVLVAEQWYGVRQEELSPRVRQLAPVLDSLDPSDAQLIQQIAGRLAEKHQ